jgi:hypothetical protein
MIVITHNGRTTVYEGWRAWAIIAVASIGVFLAFVLLAFLVLGLAITLSLVLILLLPTALVVFGLSALFGRRSGW